MRSRPTYADVVSTLCLVLVLSGGAYAASKITGKDVKNSSLTGKDIRNSSLSGKDVKDGSLSLADLAGGYLPGARMQTQVQLSIPPGASNPIDMTEEDFDSGGMYTPGSDYIVIKRTGTYLISGFISWGSDASPDARQVRIVIDDQLPTRTVTFGFSGPALLTQESNTVERLTAGQTVSLGVFSGDAANVSTSNASGDVPNAALTVQMISP